MPHPRTASLTVSLPTCLFVLAILIVFPTSFVSAAEVEAESQAENRELENSLGAEPTDDLAAAFAETHEVVEEPASEAAQGDAMFSDILATGAMSFEGLEPTSGCGPLGCPTPRRCRLSCHYCWTDQDCPMVGNVRQGCTPDFCL